MPIVSDAITCLYKAGSTYAILLLMSKLRLLTLVNLYFRIKLVTFSIYCDILASECDRHFLRMLQNSLYHAMLFSAMW